MLETILKLYTAAMIGEVRTPVPHLFGPPGCGKSTFAKQAADVLGVSLHTINVSRISPLELEGVQMPDKNNQRLNLLTATFWTQLKEGDILLLDEFLRGFPEVYNGMLDILTSREVGGYKLPKVFIMAASNSVATYDAALEDRLLHLPVPDIRSSISARKALQKLLIKEAGLLPSMESTHEMEELFRMEILPTYMLLDSLKGDRAVSPAQSGKSVRNLLGQIHYRCIQSTALQVLIDLNNNTAQQQAKFQYMIVTKPSDVADEATVEGLRSLKKNPRLTPNQVKQLELNIQLLDLFIAKSAQKEGEESEDVPIFD